MIQILTIIPLIHHTLEIFFHYKVYMFNTRFVNPYNYESRCVNIQHIMPNLP